jgi:hypothetical protein
MLRKVVFPILKKKIVIFFVKGESGVGKSQVSIYLACKFLDLFNKVKGTDFKLDLEKDIIYQPLEYRQKINYFLNNPKPIMIIEEMRFLMDSKLWQKAINKMLSDINATIRSIKASRFGYGALFIYNSQFFSDLTKDMRRTITYLVDLKEHEDAEEEKPLNFLCYGRFLKLYELKLKENYLVMEKRERIRGIDGKNKFMIDRVDFKQLPNDIYEKFNLLSSEAKQKVQNMRMEKLEREIAKEYGLKLEGEK